LKAPTRHPLTSLTHPPVPPGMPPLRYICRQYMSSCCSVIRRPSVLCVPYAKVRCVREGAGGSVAPFSRGAVVPLPLPAICRPAEAQHRIESCEESRSSGQCMMVQSRTANPRRSIQPTSAACDAFLPACPDCSTPRPPSQSSRPRAACFLSSIIERVLGCLGQASVNHKLLLPRPPSPHPAPSQAMAAPCKPPHHFTRWLLNEHHDAAEARSAYFPGKSPAEVSQRIDASSPRQLRVSGCCWPVARQGGGWQVCKGVALSMQASWASPLGPSHGRGSPPSPACSSMPAEEKGGGLLRRG